jgi:bacterioferritin
VTDNTFSVDVAAIRDRARQKMDRGLVTEYYGTDPAKVVDILNDVLATEIVCWMRYSRYAISATGINRAQVSGEFTEHAEEERGHAMRAAERIVITAYQEIIRWLGDTDVTTRRLMEDILAEDEEHADDILDLLGSDAGSS